jgi:hypothetical protein
MKTNHIQFERGQTYVMRLRAFDEQNRPRDLSNSKIYLAVRADAKIAPSIKLTSDDPPPAGWRVGIVIEDQDQSKGSYTVTYIPADTASLTALGHDDPWIYDIRIVDEDGNVFQDVGTSNLDLYPQVTDIPE